MLAKRLAGILPPLTFEEAIETTKVHSIAGTAAAGAGLLHERPFRSPHHTISDAGLIGGGMGMPRPGEVSLAHNGVLFLDEFPEFPRDVLEMLRQPLEDGSVTIAALEHDALLPGQLHAGRRHESVPVRISTATPRASAAARRRMIQRYLGKISGPLLDRIDIHMEVPAVPFKELRGESGAESSAEIRARVERARARQQARGFYNSDMPSRVDPQAVRARRCRRANARNGRPPHGLLRPRARPHSQSGAHHRRSGRVRDAYPPSTSPRRCSTAAWTGITGIEEEGLRPATGRDRCRIASLHP